jgi:hypothetical protein
MRTSIRIATPLIVLLAACGSGGSPLRQSTPASSSATTSASASPTASSTTLAANGAAANGAAANGAATATPADTTVPPAEIPAVVPQVLPTAAGQLAIVSNGDELLGVVAGQPPIWTLRHAIAALDGSAVGVTATSQKGTTATLFDTKSGARIGSWLLADGNRLTVVSPGGRRLAFTREVGQRTELTVVDTHNGAQHPLTFNGRLEPEAFSTDGLFVFALGYRPDGRYRVQTIDLSTGDKWDTGERWKANPTEDMTGVPVRAVMNGDLLSTLYRDPANKAHPAFVHTLNLTDAFSHCADLPSPFGTGPVGSDAIVNSADGKTLFVASEGSYASIDLDAVHRRADGEEDLVSITISRTPPIDPAALSTHGSAWAQKGLVAVVGGALLSGTRSSPLGPNASLIALAHS